MTFLEPILCKPHFIVYTIFFINAFALNGLMKLYDDLLMFFTQFLIFPMNLIHWLMSTNDGIKPIEHIKKCIYWAHHYCDLTMKPNPTIWRHV